MQAPSQTQQGFSLEELQKQGGLPVAPQGQQGYSFDEIQKMQPVDNRSGLTKFADTVSAPLKGVSEFLGLPSTVRTFARPVGEAVASSYELAGNQAPQWAQQNRLESPEMRAALKYGITPEAKQMVEQEKAQGASGAGFTDVLNAAQFLPTGLLAKGAKEVSVLSKVGRGEKLLPALKEGAKTGAKWVGAYGAAGEADKGGSFSDIAVGGLTGAAEGAVLGTGLGLLGAGVGKAAAMLDKNVKIKNIVSNREKELQRLEDSYASVRKSTKKAQGQGIDSKKILAQTDLLQNAVDDTGTIRTTQEGGAVEQLQNFIRPQEDVVRNNLVQEGKVIHIDDVAAKLKKDIQDSNILGADKIKALQKVDDEISGLALEANPDGTIPIEKIHDAKVYKYSNINYENPAAKNTDKLIAKGLKEVVQDNTDSIHVQAINDELAAHYSVLGLLEKLDGKKVAGGKLGKYFAQTVGSIVGSHFGPLGAIVGAEVGGGLKGALMKNKFSGKTGQMLERSAELESAIKSGQSSNSLGSLKINQSSTIIPTTTGISDIVPEKKSLGEVLKSKVKEVGHGEFGKIYEGVKGQDAVEFLLDKGHGEVRGAFSRPDIGEIDLVWGNEIEDGLKKILRKHKKDISQITDIVENTPASSKSDNRIVLDDGKRKAVIRLQYNGIDKKWLLTAFMKD